tara:strand:+ start:846 stop:1280 length:435 start_codon:yes stop_codon:yes gene_type:complete
MSKAVKIAVASTIIVGIGVATFFIIRGLRKRLGLKKGEKIRDAIKNEGSSGNTTTTTTTTTTPSKPKEPEYNPSADALMLKKSMAGGGTDEDLFWRITNKLTSAQKNMVKGKFNATYGNLQDWIEGDFSWSAEDRALRAWGYPA